MISVLKGSPLAVISELLGRVPSNIAPECATKLAALVDEHMNNDARIIIDLDNNYLSPHYDGQEIVVSIAFLHALWHAAYAYWVNAKTILKQSNDTSSAKTYYPDLHQDVVLARMRYLNMLESMRNGNFVKGCEWPADAPQPKWPVANTDDAECEATEMFLVALGWVLFHELGHLKLEHRGPKIPALRRKEEERADEFGENWIFENLSDTDERVREKRALGFAMAYIFIFALENGKVSSEYPAALKRICDGMSKSGLSENSWVYGFVIDTLQFHAQSMGLPVFKQIHSVESGLTMLERYCLELLQAQKEKVK